MKELVRFFVLMTRRCQPDVEAFDLEADTTEVGCRGIELLEALIFMWCFA
jgi:hypothetical protein